MGRDDAAPRLSRVLGTLAVDYVIVWLWLAGLAAINFSLGRMDAGPVSGLEAKFAGHATAFLFGTLPVVSYFALLEGSKSGQTLGKRWMRLKVVAAVDESRAGYLRAWGRNILRFLPWVAAHIAIWYVPGRPFIDPMPWLNLAICIGAMLLSLVYLASMWSSDGRTLYDRISGTMVIRAQR